VKDLEQPREAIRRGLVAMAGLGRSAEMSDTRPAAATTRAGLAAVSGGSLAEPLRGPNGLNAVRLGLAWLVLFAHSWPLSGSGNGPMLGGETAGTAAVAGFFAISGYLITGSRLSLPLWRFAWHRALRIFPGYWVMLLVVAFVLAPIVSVLSSERWSLSGACSYVMANWTTHLQSLTLPGTLLHAPYGQPWNGSVWTLWYELLCYVAVGVALAIPVVRRSVWPLAGAAVLAAGANLTYSRSDDLAVFLHLAVYFAAGATLRMLGERVPCRGDLAAGAAVLAVTACAMGELDSLGAFPVAYLALWAGTRCKLQLRADFSYGMYVYAFAVQQALADLGVVHSPLVTVVAATGVVVPLAAFSWFVVERPALGSKSSTFHVPTLAAFRIRGSEG
jgi:peptidoglycan/LPS O-acetylase OafA/YrhL